MRSQFDLSGAAEDLENAVAEYQDHYNRHRPHRSRGQLPPDVQEQPCAVQDFEARRLVRTRVLAGVIHEYRYAS
ncbi:transposase [Kutzneria buriramensis]|nr:transposase [Kutzneria buriramensis]